MLRLFKNRKSIAKKGFTLVEILVAISIFSLVAGPMIAQFFNDDRVIMQSRKETEAAYAARKIIETTIADYYSELNSISGSIETVRDGYTPTMFALKNLLENNSEGNLYASSVVHSAKYADNFTYDLSITPAGKNGFGSEDESGSARLSNYANVYLDCVTSNAVETPYCYIVSSDGRIDKINLVRYNSSNPIENYINFNFVSDGDNPGYDLFVNGSLEFGGRIPLNSSKTDFSVNCYSSKDSETFKIIFSGSGWPTSSECTRYLTKYYYRSGDTDVTYDSSFINEYNEYLASTAQQWNSSLYEIKVTVYDKDGKELTEVSSFVNVKLFR